MLSSRCDIVGVRLDSRHDKKMLSYSNAVLSYVKEEWVGRDWPQRSAPKQRSHSPSQSLLALALATREAC